VRLIGWLLLVLVMLGWTLGEVELSSQPSDIGSGPNWRHTRDGWEQAGSWTAARPAGRPKPHPVVVGLMQLLLSVTALVALPVGSFPPAVTRPHPRAKTTPSLRRSAS
jgi:hypothetical protein